jgi:hypothetical protein
MGFRAFGLPNGLHLQVMQVDDMSKLTPFEGATNRTAVFLCRKTSLPTTYPVPYNVWTSNVKQKVEQFGTYPEVMEAVSVKKSAAQPASNTSLKSAWLTANDTVLSGIAKMVGSSA